MIDFVCVSILRSSHHARQLVNTCRAPGFSVHSWAPVGFFACRCKGVVYTHLHRLWCIRGVQSSFRTRGLFMASTSAKILVLLQTDNPWCMRLCWNIPKNVVILWLDNCPITNQPFAQQPYWILAQRTAWHAQRKEFNSCHRHLHSNLLPMTTCWTLNSSLGSMLRSLSNICWLKSDLWKSNWQVAIWQPQPNLDQEVHL